MKTADVRVALRNRFCAPEWSLFFEVGDATGARQRRWADAVAMNLYPSRGLEIHGFELKTSRSDWLRELKNPEKSAPVQRYCDRWWIVAPPGVIVDGELPPTWGQYEALPAGKLRQIVPAPRLDSEPIGREFIAAMLRRASAVDEDMVRSAVKLEVDRLTEQSEDRVRREIQIRTQRYEILKKAVDEVERISGVKINSLNSDEVGRAVKAVMTAGVMSAFGGIAGVKERAAAIVKSCDEALLLLPGLDADDKAPLTEREV